jgi:hypothetical protein
LASVSLFGTAVAGPLVDGVPAPQRENEQPAQSYFDPDAVLAELKKGRAAGPVPANSQGVPQNLPVKLERLWNPDCKVTGGAGVPITISFRLGPDGRLIGTPQVSGEDSSDPAVKIEADRAKHAIYQGVPYDNLPHSIYGQKITVIFDARKVCANR